MFDAVEIEKRGKPTITICHDKFEVPARVHAETMGMPNVPLLIEPAPQGGTMSTNPAAVARAQAEAIIRALTAADWAVRAQAGA